MKITVEATTESASWRSGRLAPQDIQVYVEGVSAEYHRGLLSVHGIGPAITVFGSARSRPGDPVYREAMAAGRLLASAGFTVVTGGGGGVMEAANRGAMLAGGQSIGMPITLPHEPDGNSYLGVSVAFDHFPARKTCLIAACDAIVVFPGGFGTLDELFEVLTLVQTGKLPPRPIILFGSAYWVGLFEWLVEHTERGAFISEGDLDLVSVTDDPGQLVETLVAAIPSR